MNYELLMDTAMLAGEIMLSSGAETYRVEDTMRRILRTSNTERQEVVVMMTGIIAVIIRDDMKDISGARRVNSRATNLNKIVRANEISRKYCDHKISLEEAHKELKRIEQNQYQQYSLLKNKVSMGCVVVGFTVMFGGTVYDVLAACVVGFILALVSGLCEKIEFVDLLVDPVSSFSITAAAILLKIYMPVKIDMDILIISAIMPLVPGVAITNAVRDTFKGDYITGGGRMLEAFLKASLIAFGVGIGMALIGPGLFGRTII